MEKGIVYSNEMGVISVTMLLNINMTKNNG